MSPPPSILLQSAILKEVCEGIFKDLTNLVKSRNDLIHSENYEDRWTALRERVDVVLNNLQALTMEDHRKSREELKAWFKTVVESLKAMETTRSNEGKLYLCDAPFYLDATAFIVASVKVDVDLKWLSKLSKPVEAPIQVTVQEDPELVLKIKKLDKELAGYKLMYEEQKRITEVQKEEHKLSHQELKAELKEQSEKMNKMMEMIMELSKKP